MKTIVIYHKSDFDGIFCREIARKFLPDAELIGWEYNEPEPVIDFTTELYIMDLSVPGLMNHPRLTWIDHHKSAIEKYPNTIQGYRIDGVAACRLAWQWFFNNGKVATNLGIGLPNKQEFLDRKVVEPLAVRLAGEYDIWDRRDPDAELFQHGLRSQELTPNDWSCLLEGSDSFVRHLLDQGRALQYAKTKENASIIRNYGFTLHFEGLCFLACNHAQFNSFLFTDGVKPEHDALLGFNYNGKGQWRVSLYHAPGKEHHDLSQIAIKYNGGGHKGACGFTVNELPFELNKPTV